MRCLYYLGIIKNVSYNVFTGRLRDIVVDVST